MGEVAERRYWIEQMEAAREFIAAVSAAPVEECGEPLVEVEASAREAGVPLAYSANPHAGGRPRIFAVRRGTVGPLLAVAEALARRGWTLVLEDAFRSLAMQRELATHPDVLRKLVARVRWEAGEVPAELLKRRLDALVAPTPKTAGHMAGAAVDVSARDARGRELDRGGRYLELSHRTPIDSPFVSPGARRVRAAITEAMAAQGFVAYPYEFWHYSLGDGFARVASGSPDAARYGPVGMAEDGSVRAVRAATEALNAADAVAAAAGLDQPTGVSTE